MVTDQDRELLESLTRVNTETTAFTMDLLARKLDQDAHIRMTLMLLNAADLVLRHILPDDSP